MQLGTLGSAFSPPARTAGLHPHRSPVELEPLAITHRQPVARVRGCAAPVVDLALANLGQDGLQPGMAARAPVLAELRVAHGGMLAEHLQRVIEVVHGAHRHGATEASEPTVVEALVELVLQIRDN